MYIFILIFLSLYFLFYYNLDNIYLHFLKGFKIELQNLSEDIKLIIECCKTEKNYTLIENIVPQIKDWDKFINLSYSHGVFPLVYHTLKEFQDQISIQVLAKLKSINLDIAKQNMLMTSELIRVMKLLEENSIEALAFKGPILSHMAYRDITLRQYVDLDILIDEKDLEKASEVLIKNQFKNFYSIGLLKNKSYIDSDNDFSFFTPSNIHIELHWKLFREKIAKEINISNILQLKQNIIINKDKITTLSNEILLVYLCIHGSKHLWERIEWIVDIHKIIESNIIIKWEEVLKLSKEIKSDLSLFLGLNLSKQLFNTSYPENIELYISDKKIDKLTSKALNFLNKKLILSENYKKYQEVSFFQIYLTEGFFEKVKQLKFIYFSITKNDYQSFPLPSYLNILHYIIKPFRVFFKILVKGK